MRSLVLPVWGMRVTACTREELLTELHSNSTRNSCETVVGLNLHAAYLYLTDPAFAAFYDKADYVLADGRPVQWYVNRRLNHMGVKEHVPQLGTTDWLPEYILRMTSPRICLIGGTSEIIQSMEERVRGLNSESSVITQSGYSWTSDTVKDLSERIERFAPHVVLVGMGMPRQERVIQDLQARCPEIVTVWAAVGGAFDQLVGARTLPPKIVRRLGFEWLWRLIGEPKRLSYRYLVEPWLLAAATWRRLGAPNR